MTKSNQTLHRLLLLAGTIVSAAGMLHGAEEFTYGKWSIRHDSSTHMTDFLKNGKEVLKDVAVQFKAGNEVMTTDRYDNVSYVTTDFSDEISSGKKYTVRYSSTNPTASTPVVEQNFYLYPDKDFFLTEVILTADGTSTVATNYIAPILTEAQNLFLPATLDNRMLSVPFDNDGFITYGSFPLSCSQSSPNSLGTGRVARENISFEVTSIFNGATQQGLVIGSVDHDTWKSAVRMKGSPLAQGIMSRIECFSGVTHSTTRDADGDWLQPHGTVKGASVKSARMMVGMFDDWRTGMETYGDINAAIAPKREWNGPAPFGWNSWGGMERNVNYDGVISVSEFIKDNIQGKGHFGEDGTVFVGLDSFWDNLNWDQLKEFADHCIANGQTPGIYWTPFCDWFPGSGSRAMEGNNGYTYSDAHLKVNGKTKTLCGAGCLDPTSPATLSRINFFIDKFKAAGFKYLKLDFMTNGIVEADSYYRKDITTGVQAYNYGMKHLRERCGDDMFIVESIAPLFPANYAHARRISCDAWGEMWHTNYMMNSLSFGWWLNRVYCFNDPDHLVMGDRSEAENISRMTTGAVTGYCMLGDNLSTAGSYVGTKTSQAKAQKFATNEKVNDVIRLGKSFRPAYGHKLSGANNSVDLFTLETDDSWYIAHFNYGVGDKNITLDLNSLGIDSKHVDTSKSYECWTDGQVNLSGNNMLYSLPNNMARLYRLYKK